jgi:chromosome segregation ATPase
MSKKNTVESVDELKLDFTGKMSILMELEGYGPMEYRINDKDVCLKIIRLLLKEMGPTTTVDSYNKRTGNTFKKILDGIE